MLSSIDALDEARFPILRSLQQQFGNGDTLQKQDFLQSFRERHVVSPSPYCEPLSRLRFLKQDRFFVLQMLACLEMPETALENIPGPMRAHVLADMVQRTRQEYVNCVTNEGYTADDVKSTLHHFAMSSIISERWLRSVLRLRKGDELELTLHGVVDEFFEVLPEEASQLSMHSLAACALFYRLAPASKIRKGHMLLEPALRLLDNARGERGKQYVPAE